MWCPKCGEPAQLSEEICMATDEAHSASESAMHVPCYKAPVMRCTSCRWQRAGTVDDVGIFSVDRNLIPMAFIVDFAAKAGLDQLRVTGADEE